MTWQEIYSSKLISPEEAAGFVKSGDTVMFTMGREAFAIGLAIAARKEELKDVKVYVPSPGYDFGWYDAGWESSFDIKVSMPMPICQQAIDDRRCDIADLDMIPFQQLIIPDILLTEVSPPDEKGFCSFGQSLWSKRQQVKEAKLVIAEVNKNLIRTFGDNFVHVSELDYLVEHTPSGGQPSMGTLAGKSHVVTASYLKQLAEYVSELIKDGDTIQIGIGRTTEPLVKLGILNDKADIGYHSEATPPGIISLVRQGVITGKRKTLNPGKVVVTSLGGGSREELEWASNNPLFWLVDVGYLEDPRIIAAHDNMVAINNALMIDLTGLITAETVGSRVISAAGGQIAFVIGARLSKGGRSITVLPSTAKDGTVSRIVPLLPEGTVVTIHRNLADYVVTEYGIARLRGRTVRERTNELIRIAHPDFRGELRKEAEKLYWP